MPQSYLITSYLDVVGVYNANFVRLFPYARAMRVAVDRPERLTDQPIEDGSVTTDFRITDPISLTLTVITQGIFYPAIYAQIANAKASMTSLIVQTKASIFENIFITNMPHEEDPSMFDVLSIQIRMREILLAKSSTQSLQAKDVAKPSDQSAVSIGQQTPQAFSVPDNRSLAAKLIDNFL